ncbi:MAG: chorismate mutase [Leptolyngbya sp. SIO4C1]|nr:chorismate mutase [Leptolyngbya sp. SIO4C1]
MSASSSLATLGRYLSGEFENQAQAQADPTWYIRLRVWQRPTHLFASDSLTLFLEQANVVSQQPPYRQRVLRLQQTGAMLQGQYYALKQPLAFQYGGEQPERLAALTPDDLILLPTCTLEVTAEPAAANPVWFKAVPPADRLCCFDYQGQKKYVQLGFEVGTRQTAANQVELHIYDKGIEPETGRALWGALMGPFRLVKQAAYGIPS